LGLSQQTIILDGRTNGHGEQGTYKDKQAIDHNKAFCDSLVMMRDLITLRHMSHFHHTAFKVYGMQVVLRLDGVTHHALTSQGGQS
jgi:hypothetical protein